MKVKTSNTIIIIICVIIIVYSATYIIQKEYFQNKSSIDLVVARYKENIEWVKEYDDGTFEHIYIYNKSDKPLEFKDDSGKYIYTDLPNVGVCDHTYLYHIIHNYDNLANITVFVPGSGSLENKKKTIDFTIQKVISTQNSVFNAAFFINQSVRDVLYNFTIENWSVSSLENRDSDGRLELAEIRPFGKWYETFFPGVEMKYSVFGGIFAVSREHIRSRDKEFYEMLIQQVNKHKFHEASHYIERSWTSIFSAVSDECFYVN